MRRPSLGRPTSSETSHLSSTWITWKSPELDWAHLTPGDQSTGDKVGYSLPTTGTPNRPGVIGPKNTVTARPLGRSEYSTCLHARMLPIHAYSRKRHVKWTQGLPGLPGSQTKVETLLGSFNVTAGTNACVTGAEEVV